jgi:hypothetical protein
MRRKRKHGLLLEILFKFVIFCVIVRFAVYVFVFVVAFYILTAIARIITR